MKIMAVFVIAAATLLTACSAQPAVQESNYDTQVAPTITPSPKPIPTIDPLCENVDTIVYVVERQKMWLSFLDLMATADAHIAKNNLKELRKDANNARALSNRYMKTLAPPSFLRNYNEYMTAATAMYGEVLSAHADGKTNIEDTYRQGVGALLNKASDAYVEAWTYCQWVPEPIPFPQQH